MANTSKNKDKLENLVEAYKIINFSQIINFDSHTLYSIIHNISSLYRCSLCSIETLLYLESNLIAKEKPLEHHRMVSDFYKALQLVITYGEKHELPTVEILENIAIKVALPHNMKDAYGVQRLQDIELPDKGDNSISFDELIHNLEKQITDNLTVKEAYTLSYSILYDLSVVFNISSSWFPLLVMYYIQAYYSLPFTRLKVDKHPQFLNTLESSIKNQDSRILVEYMLFLQIYELEETIRAYKEHISSPFFIERIK